WGGGPDRRLIVAGPPILLLALPDKVRTHGPTEAHPCSLAVAIGGWKRAGGAHIPRAEFDARVREGLGLGPSAVRDAFNMVELNTVMIECPQGRKHVPPWLWTRARDPHTLAVIDSGKVGILAYLDATPVSYPGFILS